MSLKDWLSSTSYRQATIKHAKNANPYLKETAIAAGMVAGISTLYCSYLIKKLTEGGYTTTKWHLITKPKSQFVKDFETLKSNIGELPLDYRVAAYSWGLTKTALLKPMIVTAPLYTGIKIFQVTYCDDKGLSVEGVSTGLSNSWKQTCDAAYGAKEIGYCAGNAVGYLGAVIAVDGIYDHVVVPCMGDVLHIH